MEGNPLHEKYPMYYDENGFPYSRTQRRKQDRERSAASMLEAAWLRNRLTDYVTMMALPMRDLKVIEDFLMWTEGKR